MSERNLYQVLLSLILLTVSISISCTGSRDSTATNTAPNEIPRVSSPADEVFDGQKVVKSEDEWRAYLSPEAFYVLRQEGTERPYSGKYEKNKEPGDYYCAACHLKLFSSKAKFESGTGLPSFFEPVNEKNIVEVKDDSLGMERIEIECARCGSHLGHVFEDGPKPTGLRYCMNSVSLTFEPSH